MEASARLLSSPSLNRHLLLGNYSRSANLRLHLAARSHPPLSARNPNPRNSAFPSSIPSHRRSAAFSSASPPSSTGSLFSLSISQVFPSLIARESANPPVSDSDEGFRTLWDPEGVDDGGDGGFCGDKGAIFTVVLLGWLGSEKKHLKRYAEIYNSRGIRSVRFVVPVSEFLGFYLWGRVEERIAGLTRELVSWCSESEKDGRERHLLFHTFSNTGWLTYGAILENLQSRSDIVEKIKGCVVDSGPASEISPQVWAAGFCAALLKKRSSLTYSSVNSNMNSNRSNLLDMTASLREIVVMSVLEKFFSVVLMLPVVNQRLSRIISILSKNQPSCPQLYLYSSADKVIPIDSVERFIQAQKALGRNVDAYDFGSSPHVDHFRSFPHIYSAKVADFLMECCSPIVSQTA